MIKIGNELRQNFAPSYLAQQINLKIKDILKNNPKQNFAVDSIRSPFEAKELMKNHNFTLVGIDAPPELRFKRLLERNRLGDAKTPEDFKKQEERENLRVKLRQIEKESSLGLKKWVKASHNQREKYINLLLEAKKEFAGKIFFDYHLGVGNAFF